MDTSLKDYRDSFTLFIQQQEVKIPQRPPGYGQNDEQKTVITFTRNLLTDLADDLRNAIKQNELRAPDTLSIDGGFDQGGYIRLAEFEQTVDGKAYKNEYRSIAFERFDHKDKKAAEAARRKIVDQVVKELKEKQKNAAIFEFRASTKKGIEPFLEKIAFPVQARGTGDSFLLEPRTYKIEGESRALNLEAFDAMMRKRSEMMLQANHLLENVVKASDIETIESAVRAAGLPLYPSLSIRGGYHEGKPGKGFLQIRGVAENKGSTETFTLWERAINMENPADMQRAMEALETEFIRQTKLLHKENPLLPPLTPNRMTLALKADEKGRLGDAPMEEKHNFSDEDLSAFLQAAIRRRVGEVSEPFNAALAKAKVSFPAAYTVRSGYDSSLRGGGFTELVDTATGRSLHRVTYSYANGLPPANNQQFQNAIASFAQVAVPLCRDHGQAPSLQFTMSARGKHWRDEAGGNPAPAPVNLHRLPPEAERNVRQGTKALLEHVQSEIDRRSTDASVRSRTPESGEMSIQGGKALMGDVVVTGGYDSRETQETAAPRLHLTAKTRDGKLLKSLSCDAHSADGIRHIAESIAEAYVQEAQARERKARDRIVNPAPPPPPEPPAPMGALDEITRVGQALAKAGAQEAGESTLASSSDSIPLMAKKHQTHL